jgi:hypothetical protein
MRLFSLYAKSRRLERAILFLLAIWVFGVVWQLLVMRITEVRLVTDSNESTLHAIFVPLFISCVISSSTISRFVELEVHAANPLVLHRLSHIGLLLVIALSLSLSIARVFDLSWSLTRNTLGYSGLALLCVVAFGGRIAWVIPLVFTMASWFAGASSNGIVSSRAAWAWSFQPPDAPLSTLVAFLLAAVGTLGYALWGDRAGRKGNTSKF